MWLKKGGKASSSEPVLIKLSFNVSVGAIFYMIKRYDGKKLEVVKGEVEKSIRGETYDYKEGAKIFVHYHSVFYNY